MTFIDEKIRMTLDQLRGCIVSETRPFSEVGFARCGYKTENVPAADLTWETYKVGSPVSFKRDEHAWLTLEADVPACAETDAWYLRMTTGKEGQWDACNPQCTVFINGDSAVQAFDTNHTELLLTPGHKEIRIYFYAGMSDVTLFLGVSLVRRNKRVEKLWWDMSVPFEAMKCLDRNGYAYNRIMNALDHACMLTDFREKKSPAFYAGVEDALAYMEEEFYQKECGRGNDGEIALFGHTHIDVAWMWTLAQTAEKSQRSFSTVIRLMEQYPDYVFMSSQPQLYQYVKENDPALYEQIKARVAEGRWETEGAMWLEADTNLVSGESLVRQLLYGKKFMKEEFGHDDRILWLPDVFGYSAALPQILKKCGVDRFFTTKISWCETNTFPHDNFVWEGIDGSQVFAVLSDTYVKRLDPRVILESQKKHVDKKYSDVHLSTFGFGDGGGGPTAEMMENYARLKRGLPGLPNVTMKFAGDTIEEIARQFEKNAEKVRFTPKWIGELYLEMHRGTYTTMADNKKNNRRSEFLYQKAETAASMAGLLTGAAYPKAQLDEGWHTILKNQFHDIIPGSSIREVYDDSSREYGEVLAAGEKMFTDALDAVSANVKTDGGVLVYNPASFARTEIAEIDGEEVLLENIPAHGYAVVQPEKAAGSVKADEKSIENDLIRVTFDEKYHIVSVYDKEEDREIIPAGQSANVLEVFEDYPRCYDAWEITEYYKQKKWIADDVTSAEVVQNALTAGIRVTRRYGKSTITQLITLREGSKRLDFVTDIDWHEDHVLLKAAFPLDIRTSHANYEIQFGHIERPTHRNTSWDQAKFEVSAHKWADLSEADYGVALLNDAKYGYSTEENVMKLSLLKAPTYPNPVADRGQHHFTYSLYPHAGNLAQSDVVRQAYRLNLPMTVRAMEANAAGTLPESFSFVQANRANVIVETAKTAEDGNGYAVRFYDAQNKKTNVTLTFGFPVKEAYLTDMLEQNPIAVAADGNTVTVPLSNFEVKTLRVIPG